MRWVLVEAQFQMLSEEVSRHKAMFPNCDDTAVVDGKTQFSQRHVQLVHSTTHVQHSVIYYRAQSYVEGLGFPPITQHQ